MLVVLSDTHGRDDHRLRGRAREAVRRASLVIHAGDFVTKDVLNAFDTVCSLCAVYGNNDPRAIRERLPAQRVVEWDGLRIAVTHGHEHTDIGLSLFGRQANADLVVFGHSHRPGFEAGQPVKTSPETDGADSNPPRLNPGSHADPRRYQPAHAELQRDGGEYEGQLVQADGTLIETFRFDPAATPTED
jgi:putative phosphoesterase